MRFESSSEQCREDRYLNLSRLRPGDVILTFPSGLPVESAAIKLLCGGQYSHAILVLKPTVWYESEDYGVGKTLIFPDRVEVKDGCARLLRCMDRYGAVGVFRHPGLEHAQEEQLSLRLEEITNGLTFKRYPNYVRIAEDLRLLKDVPLREHLFWLMSKVDKPGLNEGMFCSEVVAYVFKSLGFPFKDKEPQQVRPSDISDQSISGLDKKDFICGPDPTATVAEQLPFPDSEHRSRHSLAQVTEVKTVTAQIRLSLEAVQLRAIADGIPAEELTPEGYPKVLVSLLESAFRVSDQTCRLVVTLGLLVNQDTDQARSRATLDIHLLEEAVKAIDDGAQVLACATEAYCFIARRRTDVHAVWKMVLEDCFRSHQGSLSIHLQTLQTLDVEFKLALEKEPDSQLRSLLQQISTRIGEAARAMTTAHDVREECLHLILKAGSAE
jgi:hypothetical protein